MPSYQYKAIDADGHHARGRLDAFNEVDLELRLRKMGLDLITSKTTARNAPSTGNGSITRQDLITFCFDMEQVSRASIPIVDGLRDLRDGLDNPGFRDILTSILEDIEGGKTLSESFAAYPQAFSKVFVSLIRAGEISGQLTEVFENLGTTLRWQDELIAQTRKLLMYPALVFVVVGAVVIFLLLYLVPKMVGLLTTMGLDLPLQTRVLIALSDITANYWWLVLILAVLASIIATTVVRTNTRAKYAFDYLILRLPIIGRILEKILLARFANFFALMYRSGITVLDAMRTSEDIVDNVYVADGLRRAGQQINAGENLSEAFQNLGMFPPLVVRMLRVGEATGALDTALLNITYFYNRDVNESVEKALKLLEPTLTLVLGIILALILFSVLTPLYEMLGQLDL